VWVLAVAGKHVALVIARKTEIRFLFIYERGRYQCNVLHCTLQNKNQFERVVHYVVDLFPNNDNIFQSNDSIAFGLLAS